MSGIFVYLQWKNIPNIALDLGVSLAFSAAALYYILEGINFGPALGWQWYFRYLLLLSGVFVLGSIIAFSFSYVRNKLKKEN